MSILSTIKNYANSALEALGIKDSSETNAQKTSPNTPIIKGQNVDEPVDKLVISNNKNKEKTQNTESNKQSIGSLKKLIENKCQKYGIDYQALLRTGMLNDISVDVLQGIEYIIDKIGTAKQNGNISKEIDITQQTIISLRTVHEALKEDIFNSFNEFLKIQDEIETKYDKKFNSFGLEEKRRTFKQNRNSLEEQFIKEKALIDALPKEKRAIGLQRLKERFRFMKRANYEHILLTQDSKTSANALIMLDSEDLSRGTKALMTTRVSNEIRQEVADYMDYNFTKGIISDYTEFNDRLTANSLREYSETVVANKSESAVIQYQNDYCSDRKTFENICKKMQNGEKLTAEEKAILSTMSTEYYTATAQAIVNGVANNVNISYEQKAQILQKLDADAKAFSDYQLIQECIKKQIENHPNLAKTYAQTKTKQFAKSPELANKDIKNNTSYKQDAKTIDIKTLYKENSEIAKAKNNEKMQLSKQNTSNPIKKQKNANDIVIQNELDTKQFSDVLKIYDKSDVIKIVLADTKRFKKHVPLVMQELKSAGKTTIAYIANTSSDEIVTVLCENLGKEKIEPYLNRNLTYTAKERIERMS